MPTYTYQCKKCKAAFEVVQSMKDDKLSHCDQCDTDNLERVPQIGGGFRIWGRGVHKPTSRPS